MIPTRRNFLRTTLAAAMIGVASSLGWALKTEEETEEEEYKLWPCQMVDGEEMTITLGTPNAADHELTLQMDWWRMVFAPGDSK